MKATIDAAESARERVRAARNTRLRDEGERLYRDKRDLEREVNDLENRLEAMEDTESIYVTAAIEKIEEKYGCLVSSVSNFLKATEKGDQFWIEMYRKDMVEYLAEVDKP